MTLYGLFFPVLAQSTAPVTQGGFDPKSLLPFVLIIVIFYFFILRPQQKRMKQQREMLSNLRRGDKVLTSGGILGTIHRVDDEKHIYVEIASNIIVKMSRASISEVLSKTEPAVTPAVTEESGEKKGKTLPSSAPLKSITKGKAQTKSSVVSLTKTSTGAGKGKKTK